MVCECNIIRVGSLKMVVAKLVGGGVVVDDESDMAANTQLRRVKHHEPQPANNFLLPSQPQNSDLFSFLLSTFTFANLNKIPRLTRLAAPREPAQDETWRRLTDKRRPK